MKIQLFPEDMLLEYVEQLLNGVEAPRVKYSQYLKDLPPSIEFSEEFASRWQSMVEPVVKKFIADTFSLQQFIFDVDGQVRKFSIADAEFWQTIDLQFSDRGPKRLYEYMRRNVNNETPLFPVVLPADALFISLAVANFKQYSYAWFEKNRANWVVWALFITWQQTSPEKVPWKACFDQPKGVPLTVRGYIYERAAAWYSCVNHIVRCAAQKVYAAESEFQKLTSEQGAASLPLRFNNSGTISQLALFGRQFAESIQNAHKYWTGEGTLALDDDRFLNGIFNSCGLARQMQDFEAVLRDYNETRGLEESVNESVIFN